MGKEPITLNPTSAMTPPITPVAKTVEEKRVCAVAVQLSPARMPPILADVPCYPWPRLGNNLSSKGASHGCVVRGDDGGGYR